MCAQYYHLYIEWKMQHKSPVALRLYAPKKNSGLILKAFIS